MRSALIHCVGLWIKQTTVIFFLFQEDMAFFLWRQPTNCLWHNCRVFPIL